MKVFRVAVRVVAVIIAAVIILSAVLFFAERIVYPLSDYKEQIMLTAKAYGIKPTLVFSIVKTESGFNKDAVSSKGAVGLMQLSESTAKYIAKMKVVSDYDLKNPSTNLDFGCYYYKYLSKKFTDYNTCLAAYNAGEGKVKNWLNDSECSDDGITLKQIPIKETADYVKKVNKSLSKYKKLYFNILDKR